MRFVLVTSFLLNLFFIVMYYRKKNKEIDNLVLFAKEETNYRKIDKAIEEFKAGRPIIVADDEDRENEGSADCRDGDNQYFDPGVPDAGIWGRVAA